MDIASLWWRVMPGPPRMINDIRDTVLRGQTFWIPSTTPWVNRFLTEVETQLSRYLSGSFITVDARYEENDPRSFLLPSSCSPAIDTKTAILSQYRTEQVFCLVRGLDPSQKNYTAWVDLAREVAKKQTTCTLRIACHGIAPASLPSKIVRFNVADYSSVFDVLLLSMYALSSLGHGSVMSTEYKSYLCQIATQACLSNIETIETCISQLAIPSSDPEAVLTGLGLSKDKVRMAISVAQMKSLLPKIEEQRLRLIKEIDGSLLPLMKDRYIDDFDNAITNVNAFELRHIRHFYNDRDLALTTEQANKLDILYRARNRVAHNQIVLPDTAAQILSM